MKTVLFFLIILNLYLLFFAYNRKEKLKITEKMILDLKGVIREDNLNRDDLKKTYLSYGRVLGGLKLQNEKTYKVIMYFTERSCMSCVQSVLQDMEILSNKVGYNNVVVATNMRGNKTNIYSSEYNLKHIFIESLGIPLKSDKPIILVLDSNNIIEFVYKCDLVHDFQNVLFTEILPRILRVNTN